LWVRARKATRPHPVPDPTPRHIQLAALIEALILGYEVSRKDRRTR
jgi:hypothetical protein